MSEEKKVEKTQVQILCDAFEGMKGRRPKSDQELNEWLATDEGKQATMLQTHINFTLGRNRTCLERADLPQIRLAALRCGLEHR